MSTLIYIVASMILLPNVVLAADKLSKCEVYARREGPAA
jgi:hypothetical protein